MSKLTFHGAAVEAPSALVQAASPLLHALCERFAEPLENLLASRVEARAERAAKRARGEAAFDFLASTAAIRASDFRVAPPPSDVLDRRVEITGPVDRKMVINALNSGANVFMADFEDSTCPTWKNLTDGQQNLFDAVRRTITFEQGPKSYALRSDAPTATLFVRPRGLHLPELHVRYNDRPVPGALFDFAVYFFHNAQEALARGTRPYFYLPKLESHLEARWWNDVFVFAQAHLGVPRGTIRATVLIETLPAAFEMDEILYELREHSLGLNCGRWDYIFSFIKQQQEMPEAVLPDRAQVTMDKGFLSAYSRLLIQTCHRRGAFAMGGMAAQIPIKDDAERNQAALDRVRADKLREVRAGHDGTWVAHPALVALAKEVFDAELPTPNQIERIPGDVITRDDLLAIPHGERTLRGLEHNIRVGLRYIEAWLRGVGCVPIDNLMEDAATAEISRSQIWQWLQHGAEVQGVGRLTLAEVTTRIDEAARTLGDDATGPHRFADAAALFLRGATHAPLEEFLTLNAYEALVREGH